MNENQIALLSEIFRLVLELPGELELARVNRLNTAKWDSLANVTLVTAIENEFNVSFDTHDAERMSSFKSAQILIEEKLS
jgi:acyl carrier protein